VTGWFLDSTDNGFNVGKIQRLVMVDDFTLFTWFASKLPRDPCCRLSLCLQGGEEHDIPATRQAAGDSPCHAGMHSYLPVRAAWEIGRGHIRVRLPWKAKLKWDREVWKARHNESKQLFALKKILMHNEKEGVWAPLLYYKHWLTRSFRSLP